MAEEKNRVMKFDKVHRAVYSFNILKIFIPIRRFIKKSTELTPSMIGEYISSMFRSTVTKDNKAKERAKAIEHKSPFVRNMILVSIALILLIIGYGAFLYLHISAQQKTIQQTPAEQVLSPKINVNLVDSGFLDSSGSNTRWFTSVDLGAQNLDNLNASFLVQQNVIPQDVYVLRMSYYQYSSHSPTSHYPEFYTKLKETLAESGIFVSEITVNDLLSMPTGKKIILIVPSGYFPSLLLGEDNPQFDMKSFAQNGNVLIYIGYPPSNESGSILTPQSAMPQLMPAGALDNLSISFSATDTGQPPSPFVFQSPSHLSVQGQAGGSGAVSTSGQGGVYSVNWGGEGFAYFIGTTIDEWWAASGQNSAVQLANAISSAQWGVGLAKGTLSLNATNNTLSSRRVIIFSGDYSSQLSSSRIGKAYGQLIIQGTKNSSNTSYTSGKLISVLFKDRPYGTLQVSTLANEQAISSLLTGEPLQITYSLDQPNANPSQIFLGAIASDGTKVPPIPITSSPESLQVKDMVYLFNDTLSSGDYILQLTDSAGNLLAQSYLEMVSFKPKLYIADFPQGVFSFNVYMDDEKNAYSSTLNNIKISLNGGAPREVSSVNGQILYNMTPTTTQGNYTFLFQFGSDTVPLTLQYIRPTSVFEKPENIVAIVITLLLFGLGMMITRPEIISYGIDVPDFPPLQAIAIPVTRDTVLDVFESVNRDLKWKQTPLSIPDLKSGFKKVLYHGRSIIIGDYNLELILDKLKEEGYVDQAMDYYGLKRWERETHKSIHYLAMTRAIRDTFVTEGIPFLPFGQRGDADTVVSYGGEKVFIHIYETDNVIKRAIASASVGRSIVVFENELIMQDFLSRIHSSNEMNVVFKLLLDNGKISVAPVNRLMDVLNRKKVFRY